ncbi:BTB/POZ domain-containing protein 6, partial [Stylophora pistillata]
PQTVIMSLVEGNWQTTRPTIRERVKFVFNSDRFSDIKFVVQKMDGESERKRVIPAHKFVLSISSPVFEAMFYGELAETTDSIELPDCEYESLLELFRYMYSDEVNLSGSNVMGVLYLAKKYMVPSLADKCAKYLLRNLDPYNVFSILPSAQKYEEKDLVEQCWKVIDEKIEEVVKSEGFATVQRSLLELIVVRDTLMIEEIDLFKAVDLWATKQCERQGLEADGETKRRILGEQTVKAIRFPTMNQEDFVGVVLLTDILTKAEIVSLTRYFSSISKSTAGFPETTRSGATGEIQRCCRFNSSPSSTWSYKGRPDVIDFSTDRDIILCGLRLNGKEDSTYCVDVNLEMVGSETVLMSLQTGPLHTNQLQAKNFNYSGFELNFSTKIILRKNTRYRLSALIRGPISKRGVSGVSPVQCSGVTFTFMNSDTSNDNGSSVISGQFPELIFCLIK